MTSPPALQERRYFGPDTTLSTAGAEQTECRKIWHLHQKLHQVHSSCVSATCRLCASFIGDARNMNHKLFSSDLPGQNGK